MANVQYILMCEGEARGPGRFGEVTERVAASELHQSIDAVNHSLNTGNRHLTLVCRQKHHQNQAHISWSQQVTHHTGLNPSASVGTGALGNPPDWTEGQGNLTHGQQPRQRPDDREENSGIGMTKARRLPCCMLMCATCSRCAVNGSAGLKTVIKF